jgi:hypothetical protein
MMSIVLAVILMSVGGTAWASPSQQGTVPVCDSTDQTNIVDTLNTCTGTANVPSNALPPGGNAIADELSQNELNNLGAPPSGQNFRGNGLNLQINDGSGNPVSFFGASVTICFPTIPGHPFVIRRWYTAAELQALGRITTVGAWISFPSFTSGGQTCTRTRLPGTYVPIG